MADKKTNKEIDEVELESPLSLRELLVIVLSGHIGVRKREQRANDFGRANGLHVFIAALFYFALVVTVLIILVNYVTR